MSDVHGSATPARVEGLDGLRSLVGRQLGPTPVIAVDQARIDAFADTTEDRQWIHTDPERAAGGPFGSTIAHGYLTLSLVPAFVERLLVVDGIKVVVNYGMDKVRFPAPVPVGSALRSTAEVLEVEDVQGGAQARIRVAITADGAPKPACVAEILFRYYV